ncbi:MAG: hypothetical protein L0Z50_22300 [Verrucomicrobiales bacterium]|nr:hypothetical protein [Verrucomicrobiales bacterium]
MNNSLCMGVVESFSHLRHQLQGFGHGQDALRLVRHVLQGLPVDELHHNVRGLGLLFFTHIVNRYDARMGELAGGLCFPEESLPVGLVVTRAEPRSQDGLYGHGPVDDRIMAKEDCTHCASSQF